MGKLLTGLMCLAIMATFGLPVLAEDGPCSPPAAPELPSSGTEFCPFVDPHGHR